MPVLWYVIKQQKLLKIKQEAYYVPGLWLGKDPTLAGRGNFMLLVGNT